MIEETMTDIDLKLFDLVREVMARKSRIQVVVQTIARFLHCSSLHSREADRLQPSLEYMQKHGGWCTWQEQKRLKQHFEQES